MAAAAPPMAIFRNASRRLTSDMMCLEGWWRRLPRILPLRVRCLRSWLTYVTDYAQYAFPAGALMTTLFSTPIAFFSPSSPDISESSCSMLMT